VSSPGLEPYRLDSGPIANAAASGTVFLDVVQVRGASWLRLYFGDVELARGSFIRITAPHDNEIQELDRRGLALWGNTSAYFNGDTLIVELVAGAGTADNRLVIEQIARDAQPVGGSGDCGICGNDDRVSSSEDWASRLLPAGCTASVYNEASCLVSAGHCIGGSMVIHFNVPDSDPDCSINNPPVADQFPILTTDFVNGGVGNDWSVLIPGPNNLGELPFERYGELRPIASSPASIGETATVWGYGVDNTCVRSQTQQTDSGPITDVTGTLYEWEIDIRGGNSGSSLIHDGEIIGIVTHCNTGGCPAFDNIGTRIDLPAFEAAREALCGENLSFTFPDGLPELIAPAGGTTVRVLVGADSGTPMPGTGMVHVSVDGGPFVASAMAENAPNDYDAVFPSVSCAAIVEYYFSAETTTGVVVTSPGAAPDQAYVALGGDNAASEFDDDFETDQGWTVSNQGLSDGAWERGVPISNAVCNRGNPGTDADDSGQCYLTDNSPANSCNSDVDDGSTTLTSPAMDASDPASVVSYWRWFSTVAGSNPFQDVFVVEVSDDDGSSWTTLETVGPSGAEVAGGWFHKAFRVGDFVDTTNEFRIRFIASDTDPQSVVEAGVDGVELLTVSCGLCGNGVPDAGEDCENGTASPTPARTAPIARRTSPARGAPSASTASVSPFAATAWRIPARIARTVRPTSSARPTPSA
jgi:hypothetical protein